MSGILPILNNYNTNPTHNYTRTMRIIRDHIESYNVRTEILKDDISDIVTFIDSHIKEESFKTNTAELFVRFAETLIIEKHFDEAYEVLSALEGSKGLVSEDSQVEGLIRRLEINSAFLETICAKSVTNPNDWFDFPYSKFLSLKADALKGMKRYSEAIKQYDLALQNGAAGKASDFRPYALVGKYEAEVKTGAVTATNAPQKAAELKRKIETYTGEKVSAKEIDKLNKRIERSLETVNKDFATIDKDIDAEIVASSKPFDKAQLNETKAWNLLNWAKSIAFDNPDASDPKLKCDAKSCPQVDILLKKAEAIIPELTPAVSAEVTKHVNNTKLLFLLKWAEKISATDSKLAFAKVKEAEALIDKTNIEQFAWLVWSYANIAKTGNAEALKKTLELSDKKEDQIDKVSKKGKIKAAIGYAKIECAKNAKGIENIQAALKAAKDYCINNNLGGLYVKCLWEMNTNKEDLQVLKELAAIYKTISGRTLETIKDLQPSPDITFSTDDKIDPQDIAIILDKISTLLKGKQDPSASKYAEAAKTEYKYYLERSKSKLKIPRPRQKI